MNSKKVSGKNKLVKSTEITENKKKSEFAQEQYITILNNKNCRCRYFENFMEKEESQKLMDELSKIEYTVDKVKIFGKIIDSPRKVCAFSSDGRTYSYAGFTRGSIKWTPKLLKLKEKLENMLGETFNYALVNRYSDGSDYIGWHADNEKDITEGSTIASISLGQKRKFSIKDIATGEEKYNVELENGSLVSMEGDMQKMYKHCVPKSTQKMSVRYNITFRNIKSPSLSIINC